MISSENLINAAVIALILIISQVSRLLPHVPQLWREISMDPCLFHVVQKHLYVQILS